jgi:hypothetical protein
VKAKPVKGANERTGEEIEVFEDAQNREIQDERKNKPLFPAGVRAGGGYFLSDQKVDGSAADHEREKSPIPPAVEEVARKEKENVLSSMIEAPIEEHDWNEEQEIGGRIENHIVKSNFRLA